MSRRGPLRARWLGRVRYQDAHALQHALFEGTDDHLLLLEHPHVYTLGVRAERSHVLVDPASVGAELVETDRGGDVTYHGPGQLVGYPVMSVAGKGGGNKADTLAYVRTVEQLIIDVLERLGLPGAARLPDYPGVWVDVDGPSPRKIAAIGVRLTRGRSMHGFALNVAPDMAMFNHIIPCGIPDKAVTSLAEEGIEVEMRQVVDAVVERAAELFGFAEVERHDLAWRVGSSDLAAFTRSSDPAAEAGTSVRIQRRLEEAGVSGGLPVRERKPEWMRVELRTERGFTTTRSTVHDLGLVTVCEEAGCPNIYECWTDGTATFMIGGERCTRACGFCLVDTRHPEPLDATEPQRVADAVDRMGLSYAVITAVARDDVADGGAAHFAATIEAVRAVRPDCRVEVLIPDCQGDPASLQTIYDARPDVLNHNTETVLRLQRAVRPSASYARSLAVLARAKGAGLVTKSGIIVGMGETDHEVEATLADLAAVGCDIVTIGQYLRPTAHHLPVARWVEPATFDRYREVGEALGIGHVESSPLTRSSHHAQESFAAVASTVSPA